MRKRKKERSMRSMIFAERAFQARCSRRFVSSSAARCARSALCSFYFSFFFYFSRAQSRSRDASASLRNQLSHLCARHEPRAVLAGGRLLGSYRAEYAGKCNARPDAQRLQSATCRKQPGARRCRQAAGGRRCVTIRVSFFLSLFLLLSLFFSSFIISRPPALSAPRCIQRARRGPFLLGTSGALVRG